MCKYIFQDPQLGIERDAEIKGIKLIFKDIKFDEKGNFKSGIPYIVFTCDIPDLQSKIPIKQDTCDWYSEKKAIRKLREKIKKSLDGKSFVTCAVDLGIRHLGTATVRENGKIVRTRVLWDDVQKYLSGGKVVRACGPTLSHIAHHKLELRKGRNLFLVQNKCLNIHYLPAYHPELNYQEILWRTMRYEETTNAFFETIEDLEAAIFKRSQRWKPKKLKSLCQLI